MLRIKQHDDEEKQRDDRARINQHEQHGEQVGLQQGEERGHAHEAEQEAERGVDGIAPEHGRQGGAQGEGGEQVEEQVGHGWTQWTLPCSAAAFFLSHLKCSSGSVPPSS